MPSRDTVERFAALFPGLDRAYGVSVPSGTVNPRGKHETRYRTIQSAVPSGAWERHLIGSEGLVITPVTDAGTAQFGAIDIDIYSLNAADLVAKIARAGYPLTPCLTKSGGLHLYLFLTEMTDAALVRRALKTWALALGFQHSEVFPKQERLASARDLGSGINLPYFGGQRCALDRAGRELSLEEFVARCEHERVSPQRLSTAASRPAVAPASEGAVPPELTGAPPCLVRWAREGVGEGSRNEVMFDFAIYCKRRYDGQADWREKLEELNARYCRPPLAAPELLMLFRSVAGKGTYSYKAKCEGPHCDPKNCKRAEFGARGGFEDTNLEVSTVVEVRTTPRYLILTINGKNVEFKTDELLDQRAFQRIVWEELGVVPVPVRADRWIKLIEGWRKRAEVQEAPVEASDDGQLLDHLDHYRRRYPAKSAEELRLEGRAWFDPARSRVYVRAKDLLGYLRRERAGRWTAQELYQALRRLGGGRENLALQGETVATWWVPMAPENRTPVSASTSRSAPDQPF